MTGHRQMLHISQSTIVPEHVFMCLTKRNPQKINKEERSPEWSPEMAWGLGGADG